MVLQFLPFAKEATRMNNLQPRLQRWCISRGILRFILVCVVGGLQPAIAQDRGNTSAQEYGDPVYRVLDGIAGFLGYNYNHAGVFAGLDSGHNGRVMQILGAGDTTEDASFYTMFTSYGS